MSEKRSEHGDQAKKSREAFNRLAWWVTGFSAVFAGGVGGEIGLGWGLAVFAVLAVLPYLGAMLWVAVLFAGSFANLKRALELADEPIKNLPESGVASLRLKLDEHHGTDPRCAVNAKAAEPDRFAAHRVCGERPS